MNERAPPGKIPGGVCSHIFPKSSLLNQAKAILVISRSPVLGMITVMVTAPSYSTTGVKGWYTVMLVEVQLSSVASTEQLVSV